MIFVTLAGSGREERGQLPGDAAWPAVVRGEDPIGLGTGHQRCLKNFNGLLTSAAAGRNGPIRISFTGNEIAAFNRRAVWNAEPGNDAQEVPGEGGTQKVDLVAPRDEHAASLLKLLPAEPERGRVVDGRLFEVVEIGGIVDVAKAVHLVESDPDERLKGIMGRIHGEISGMAHAGVPARLRNAAIGSSAGVMA